MGEVWRARDTRLKRDVALKILPAAFVSDPDRLARFQREAEVLASLNHPSIAQIYGLEGLDGHAGPPLALMPTSTGNRTSWNACTASSPSISNQVNPSRATCGNAQTNVSATPRPNPVVAAAAIRAHCAGSSGAVANPLK